MIVTTWMIRAALALALLGGGLQGQAMAQGVEGDNTSAVPRWWCAL